MIEFDPVLVHEWLSRSARRFPDKLALIYGQQRWTYQQIDQHSTHLAAALMKAGVQRHDRVVVLLNNSPETVIALYGILKAAATFILLEASVKGPKLKYILQNSGARVLITNVNKEKVVRDAIGDSASEITTVWVGPKAKIPDGLSCSQMYWDEIFSPIDDQPADRNYQTNHDLPRCIDVDLASLIYTSGSTGRPKGVMCTHHNMISAACSIIQYIDNSEDDIILTVLPLSFDYGLYQVVMAFMFGGTVVLETSFMYLHRVLERIALEKVTGFPVVPTIVAMLLRMQNIEKYDFSTLKYITNTGAALPVKHIRRLRTIFPQVKIFSMFGLTECKRVGYMPPAELDRRPSSVGRAMPNSEVFVVDEDGREVPAEQTGELIIRGSNVMQGYWSDPELSAQTYKAGDYPADRILYSGDQFRRDEQGFLYFLGRRDDMIKSKGERISAKEVENGICTMPGVAEAAVIGVPDEIFGQAIKAFIVPAPETILTEKDVLKFCSQNMETFTVPKYVVFMESLPKTANGKIDKKKLKNTVPV